MKNNNLPTQDLQKYGIINEDESFNEKLKPEDVAKFLQGYTIVADHEDSRATFQLINDQKSLKVILLERDSNIKDVLKKSIHEIQYSEIKDISKSDRVFNFEKKAFVYDTESRSVIEYDLLQNISELTQNVVAKNDAAESNRYKTELLKIKSFLQDKIDQFPEMAKEITNDLNIISKEINIVDAIFSSQKQKLLQKTEQTKIQLNVNDPDNYQQANDLREESNLSIEDEEFTKGRKR